LLVSLGLKAARVKGIRRLEVSSNSDFVINQLKNRFYSNSGNISKKFWNLKFDSTKDLYTQTVEYESKFLSLTYELASMEKNSYAISMANFSLFGKGYKFGKTLGSPKKSNQNYQLDTNDTCTVSDIDDDESEYETSVMLQHAPPLIRQQASVEF
jgi:hypothetical protein